MNILQSNCWRLIKLKWDRSNFWAHVRKKRSISCSLVITFAQSVSQFCLHIQRGRCVTWEGYQESDDGERFRDFYSRMRSASMQSVWPISTKKLCLENAKIHHNLASIHPCPYNMKKKVSAKNKCQVASWWVRHSYNKLIRKIRHDMGVLEHKLTYMEKACRLLYNILGRRLCKGRAYGAMGRFCAWRDSAQVDVEERSRLWVVWGEHFDFGCIAVASSEVDHLILYVARYNRPQIPLEKLASFTPNFTRSNAGVHGRISRGAHRDKK